MVGKTGAATRHSSRGYNSNYQNNYNFSEPTSMLMRKSGRSHMYSHRRYPQQHQHQHHNQHPHTAPQHHQKYATRGYQENYGHYGYPQNSNKIESQNNMSQSGGSQVNDGYDLWMRAVAEAQKGPQSQILYAAVVESSQEQQRDNKQQQHQQQQQENSKQIQQNQLDGISSTTASSHHRHQHHQSLQRAISMDSLGTYIDYQPSTCPPSTPLTLSRGDSWDECGNSMDTSPVSTPSYYNATYMCHPYVQYEPYEFAGVEGYVNDVARQEVFNMSMVSQESSQQTYNYELGEPGMVDYGSKYTGLEGTSEGNESCVDYNGNERHEKNEKNLEEEEEKGKGDEGEEEEGKLLLVQQQEQKNREKNDQKKNEQESSQQSRGRSRQISNNANNNEENYSKEYISESYSQRLSPISLRSQSAESRSSEDIFGKESINFANEAHLRVVSHRTASAPPPFSRDLLMLPSNTFDPIITNQKPRVLL